VFGQYRNNPVRFRNPSHVPMVTSMTVHRLPRKIETWLERVAELADAQSRAPWILGDELVRGEDAYGEAEARAGAAAVTGRSAQNIKDLAWVARAVPESRRRYELAWRSHRLVAKLPASRQRYWLRDAARFGLSSDELQREMWNEGEATQPKVWPKPALEGEYECPRCHYVWTGSPVAPAGQQERETA
jgi:hypothetical protein